MATGLTGYVIGMRSGNEVGGIEFADSSDEISELLDSVPSGEQAMLRDGATLQVVGSFSDGNGRFCREFEVGKVAKNGFLAVSCQVDGQWVVELAVQMARNDSFKPASSTSVIASYLSEIGAGEVMSAGEERALLERKPDQ